MQFVDIFGERRAYHYNIDGLHLVTVHAVAATSQSLKETASETEYDLFVNHIWPGSIVMADFICRNKDTFRGKVILEVGAGAALPSIVADLIGARLVVASDFGHVRIVETMDMNARNNRCQNLTVTPHAWGDDVQSLFNILEAHLCSAFDIILAAECLWKDTVAQHRALLETLYRCVLRQPDAVTFVFFAHRPCEGHRPEQDMNFFKLAEDEFGFRVSLLGVDSSYADAMDSKELMEVKMYSLRRG